jgi:hypothetical protein
MNRSRPTPRIARRGASASGPQGPQEELAPKLPHERDETPDPAPGADRAKVRRGAADLAAGRKDTDCYGAARRVFGRAAQGRKR